MNKKPGLPLNQDDVLKIVRRGKELGMTYSDFAEALHIPVKNLHSFVLRHGTLEDAIQILRELRPHKSEGQVSAR